LTISCPDLLRIRNVSDEFVEKINTHFMFSNFFPENLQVYETIRKNIIQPDRPNMTTSSILIACWIHRATDTHTEYLILLFHGNNFCTNAPKCNVIYTLPVLLYYGKYFFFLCVDPFDNKNSCYLVPAVVW